MYSRVPNKQLCVFIIFQDCISYLGHLCITDIVLYVYLFLDFFPHTASLLGTLRRAQSSALNIPVVYITSPHK